MPQKAVIFVLLALMLVGFIGPWIYETDGVPPPEFCDERFTLLEDGRCAREMPGLELLGWFGSGLTWILTHPAESLEYPRDTLFTLVLLLPFLPLASLLLLGLLGSSPARSWFHRIVLILALVLLFFFIVDNPYMLSVPMWGLWLYLLGLVGALVWELAGALYARKALAGHTES